MIFFGGLGKKLMALQTSFDIFWERLCISDPQNISIHLLPSTRQIYCRNADGPNQCAKAKALHNSELVTDFILSSSIQVCHGSFNVLIFHITQPLGIWSTRWLLFWVMSNSPKMGHLPIPVCGSIILLLGRWGNPRKVVCTNLAAGLRFHSSHYGGTLWNSLWNI